MIFHALSTLRGCCAKLGDVATLDDLRQWLAATDNAVVLTGAGISTDSGIPDFRGPNGVWTKNPQAERSSHIDEYLADGALRVRAWQNRLVAPLWDAQPNSGHRAVADLQRAGHVSWVVTQNIDGLHQRAGSDADRVLELHGTAWRSRCTNCGDERPMGDTLERVRAGEADPPCLVCGGILKSATISFGQQLDPDVLDAAATVCAGAELLLAVGSTLSVYPAAGLVPLAVRQGARLVILNADETPYDHLADLVLHQPIGSVLPALA